MMGAKYPTKKALKASIGTKPRFVETSMFGPEYIGDGSYTVVGPNPWVNRRWYATVTIRQGLIAKIV